MSTLPPNDAEEARRKARERLAARQGRIAVEEGRRPRKAREQNRKRPRSDRGAAKGDFGSADDAQSTYDRPSPGRALPGVSVALGHALDAVRTLIAAIGVKRIAIVGGAVIVAVLLIVGIATFAQSCSSDAAEAPQQQDEQTEAGQNAVTEPVVLPEGLDAEVASGLEAAAADNADIAWIANHAADYAIDGDAVQLKLLKLALEEPEAVAFVRGFPDAYPADAGSAYEEAVEAGSVPLLYQWDQRWGYTVYSSTTFALTGCCPTALSMVYMGLTGNNDITPYDMGVRAQNGGYMTQYNGTDGSFLANEAASLGLACSEIGVSSDSLRDELNRGNVVICNVGPGDFTESGHYFVITGLNDDGTLSVNDPYSAERSAKSWDVDQVIGQTKALYSYSAA